MKTVTKSVLTVYSHPSFYSGFQDTHTFAVSSSGEKYCNAGGIYNDQDVAEVCKGNVYQTWLNQFMPGQGTDIQSTGIKFGQNGVCHTYAMREVLLCDEELNTLSAMGDDMCVAYYGKYGTGLQFLSIRLRESFGEAKKQEELPDELLDKVLARICGNVSYETDAWISVFKNYLHIDVMSYYRGAYDRYYLERRIEYLMNKREELFNELFDYNTRHLDDSFSDRRKELYINEFSIYMHDLARYGYFSEDEASQLTDKFKDLLIGHARACRLMQLEMENGRCNL